MDDRTTEAAKDLVRAVFADVPDKGSRVFWERIVFTLAHRLKRELARQDKKEAIDEVH